MASRLEQAKTAIDQLRVHELGVLQTYLAGVKRKKKRAPFRFLDLPPELRCLVYTFYGRKHLKVEGLESFPSLLGVSKQSRIEFMEIFYSNKTVKLEYLAPENKGWVAITNSTLLKSVLDHKKARTSRDVCHYFEHDTLYLRSSGCKRWASVLRPIRQGIGPGKVFLILEVVGTMSEACLLVYILEEKLEEAGVVLEGRQGYPIVITD